MLLSSPEFIIRHNTKQGKRDWGRAWCDFLQAYSFCVLQWSTEGIKQTHSLWANSAVYCLLTMCLIVLFCDDYQIRLPAGNQLISINTVMYTQRFPHVFDHDSKYSFSVWWPTELVHVNHSDKRSPCDPQEHPCDTSFGLWPVLWELLDYCMQVLVSDEMDCSPWKLMLKWNISNKKYCLWCSAYYVVLNNITFFQCLI